MSLLLAITLFEIIYLSYMFFIFKTNYSFNSQILGNKVNDAGKFWRHDTYPGAYENKICGFGKSVAILGIILALIRLKYNSKDTFRFNLIFVLLCLFLAALMNFNAVVYMIPIIILEIYIMFFI